DQLLGKLGGSERLDEGGGIGARERRYGQSHQLAVLVELVQRLPEQGEIRQLLLADRGDDDERNVAQPATEEGQEADAHLVGPVASPTHDPQCLAGGGALGKPLGPPEGVWGTPAASARDLFPRGGRGWLPLTR